MSWMQIRKWNWKKGIEGSPFFKGMYQRFYVYLKKIQLVDFRCCSRMRKIFRDGGHLRISSAHTATPFLSQL
jgi:hypothetical protein